MNNYLLYQICLHYYVYTYIQCGHIWNRNKLSRCQLELLISCSNDVHQTSLKWNRSSHPVAPESRVSHTLRLKIFTINVIPFCVSCNIGLNVSAEWHAGCYVRCKLSRWIPKTVISLPNRPIVPVQDCVYSTGSDISSHLRWFKTKLIVVLFHHVLSFVWRMLNNLCRVRDFKPIDLPT